MKHLIFLILLSPLFLLGQGPTLDPNELSGIAQGEKAPLFEAINQQNNTVALADLLQSGPVVLIFYRGQWCPYCTRHLSAFQEELKAIQALGAHVIAISPETPEYLSEMAEKSGARFELLWDENYKISKDYGLLFDPGEELVSRYNTRLNADFPISHGGEDAFLPIPATYVIGQDGQVIWRQFDPNYKNRSTVDEVIEVLNAID